MLRRGVTALVALTLAAGCILPIPTKRHTPKHSSTRGEIGQQVLAVLQPGATTREGVLWEFGEPDAVSADERFFLYRWITVGGYLAWAVGGGYSAVGAVNEMGVRRHDMVLQFDEQGVLARFGELESLVTEPLGDDLPLDVTLPMRLEVLYQGSVWKQWAPATLILDPASIRLVPGADPSTVLEQDPLRVVELEHVPDDGELWYDGWIGYHLHAGETGQRETLRLQIQILDLPRLAKYVQDRCPGARITG